MNQYMREISSHLILCAVTDNIHKFKLIMSNIDLNDKEYLNTFKVVFSTACDSSSIKTISHMLESEFITYLDKEEIKNSIVNAGYKKRNKIVDLLLFNDKLSDIIDYDNKILLAISHLNPDDGFTIMKKLIENNKYSISKQSDNLLLFAIEGGNEKLIEYLFDNDLAPGEQIDKSRVWEIAIGSTEKIYPIFLNLLEKLKINFSEDTEEYLKTNKNELYKLLEKKNLFNKLIKIKENEFNSKSIIKKNKI